MNSTKVVHSGILHSPPQNVFKIPQEGKEGAMQLVVGLWKLCSQHVLETVTSDESTVSVREPAAQGNFSAPCQDFPSLLGEGGEGSEKRSQGRTGLMQSPLFYEHLYYLLLKKS